MQADQPLFAESKRDPRIAVVKLDVRRHFGKGQSQMEEVPVGTVDFAQWILINTFQYLGQALQYRLIESLDLCRRGAPALDRKRVV